jgi:hypothetical protein
MIVRCSHCHQIFSEGSFDGHKCDLPLKECRRIDVVYFMDVSYDDNKLMNGLGTDGVLYTFEVVPRKATPIIMTTDEFLQRKRADKDFTEPALTLFIV